MLALYIVLGIIALIFLLLIMESIIYKRSLFSNMVELYLRITSKRKKHAKNNNKYIEYLKIHSKQEIYNKYKKQKLKSIINDVMFEEFQILTFKSIHSNPNKIILYLHGGAYIEEPLKYHIKFIDKLAANTNSIIVFPIYPKLTKYHYNDAHKFVDIIYSKIKKESSLPVIMMGDSSGGGLALSYSEYLSLNFLPVPDNIILFSPWLDISLSSKNIEWYEKKDPMLSLKPLRDMGLIWATGLPVNDYRVSPLYGNIDNINKLTIFVGTREILYPEIMTFYENNKNYNDNINIVIGKNMNHVYPIFPIKEAKKTFSLICKIINE